MAGPSVKYSRKHQMLVVTEALGFNGIAALRSRLPLLLEVIT